MRSRFRVIAGGLRREIRLRGVRVVAAPRSAQPFAVDALVLEEDTYLVLSADPKAVSPASHPIRLMTGALDFSPEAPGSVVVQETCPLRLLAVVNDVDRDPICQETWVAHALKTVFRIAEARRLKALGFQMLGTCHGRLPPVRFAELLLDALPGCPEGLGLTRLWIDAPVPVNRDVIAVLGPNRSLS
jgi:hypothetical protein